MLENDKVLKLSIRPQLLWAAINNSLLFFFSKVATACAVAQKIFRPKRGGACPDGPPSIYATVYKALRHVEVTPIFKGLFPFFWDLRGLGVGEMSKSCWCHGTLVGSQSWPKHTVCRVKADAKVPRGALKLFSPLELLTNLKVLLSFLRHWLQSLYFLLEDIYDWSMLTNFDKILLKN